MNIPKIILATILFFSPCYSVEADLPAFPGAEGFGANSIGGRGGTVIKVTNLNAYGPGSFREAVTTAPRNYANSIREWETKLEYEARVAAGNTRPRHYPNGVWSSESSANYLMRLEDTVGHRIVVFEVSGIINLESGLTIYIPYITIAGETSPGGILVSGAQTTVNTHDVIIRHMRFRVGSHQIANGADPETLDSFDIWGQYWGQLEAYNIIIDHCSFSWGVDETFTISGGVKNTTIQWSIISEGLSHTGHPKGEHSKGLFISGKYIYPSSITLSHNYIAHNTDRNPLIFSPIDVDMIVDVVNNVSYNWKGGLSPGGGGSAKINWVFNYAKQGIRSNSYSYEVIHGSFSLPASSQLYVFGNIGSTRLNQSDPHWNVGESWRNELLDEAWRQPTAWTVPPVTTTEMSHDYALEILKTVGASKPVRDSADERVVNDFINSTGDIIDNVNYPADYPTFSVIPPPVDNDNDGMADSWEAAHGMNVSTNDSALDNDGDGYTNIEEYLHDLASDETVVSVPSPSDLPGSFQLLQNYPNPFNPRTVISYIIPEASYVFLAIYNLLGQRIATLVNENTMQPGIKKVEWDGRNKFGQTVSSGLYFYKLHSGAVILSRKMLLLQ